MSDIFREVEEDIRRERMRKLWDRFGWIIIGIALAIVLGVAGWRGWEAWQTSRAAERGDAYTAALDAAEAGNDAEALSTLEDLSRGEGGYALLAKMRLATERADEGDVESAVALFDEVAGTSEDASIAGLAQLRAGYLLLDTANFGELSSRLDGLTEDGNPWRHSAREILGLSAWREGEFETASDYFQQAAGDAEVPPGLRQRADLMLELIAGQGSVEDAAGGPTEEAEADEPEATPSEPPQATQ